MRRNCLLLTSKIDVLRSYKTLRIDLKPFESWFTPLIKNVIPEFSMDNLNDYFWKAVCNKEIEHSFLSRGEIFKSLIETINDFKTEDRSKSDSFNDYFPGFFSEDLLSTQMGEETSRDRHQNSKVVP
jgi:hypothetical protein